MSVIILEAGKLNKEQKIISKGWADIEAKCISSFLKSLDLEWTLSGRLYIIWKIEKRGIDKMKELK